MSNEPVEYQTDSWGTVPRSKFRALCLERDQLAQTNRDLALLCEVYAREVAPLRAELDEARSDRDGWKVAYENLQELSSARMAALEGLLWGEVTLLESWAATSARSGIAATMERRAQQIRAALAGSGARPAEEAGR